MKKHTIWKDYWLMNKEEREEMNECARENLIENMANYEVEGEPSEEEIEYEAQELNMMYFDDDFGAKWSNLSSSKLNNYKIKVYAILGLWYGDREASKEFDNLSSAISECLEDMNEIYEDQYGNLHLEAHHHDGCNRYIFKKITEKGERAIRFRKEIYGV